jgi:methoxymalonate biosynthesis acyl carrier protein
MEIQQRLLDYIGHELLPGSEGANLGVDDNLLLSGMIDSHAVVELIAFIEEEFGVDVNPGNVTIKNFRTVNAIAAYIEQQRTEQATT